MTFPTSEPTGDVPGTPRARQASAGRVAHPKPYERGGHIKHDIPTSPLLNEQEASRLKKALGIPDPKPRRKRARVKPVDTLRDED